jgi:hypothetical protein
MMQNIVLYLITLLTNLQYIIQHEKSIQLKTINLNKTNYSILKGYKVLYCTGDTEFLD